MTEGDIMMIIMNNDESNLADIKPGSKTKVSAVQNASAIQDRQAGKNLPENTTNIVDDNSSQKIIKANTLDKAVKQINENEQIVQRELKFSIDEGSGKTVIRIMDLATNKVIRQIPNEEVLIFARRLNEGTNLKLFSEYI